jgi:hypothetical protein
MPYINFDDKTRQAITHTRHCLTGCAIGEVLGMALGTIFKWHNAVQIAAAIVLAFFFGYLLTYSGVRKQVTNFKEAAKITFATDTVSITSMETIDNLFVLFIPGALDAKLNSFLFWWSLAISLIIAFIVTVPVNRFMISRSGHMHHH